MVGNAGNIAKMRHAHIVMQFLANICIGIYPSVLHSALLYTLKGSLMSRLPRKRSRTITIDGREFRWLLHGRNRYLGRAPAVVTISIQEELEHPGITLQCMAVSVQNEEAEEECGVLQYIDNSRRY